jgi:hypothetical protein
MTSEELYTRSEPQRPVHTTRTWHSPCRGGKSVRCSVRMSLGPWRTTAVWVESEEEAISGSRCIGEGDKVVW